MLNMVDNDVDDYFHSTESSPMEYSNEIDDIDVDEIFTVHHDDKNTSSPDSFHWLFYKI